MKYEIIVNEYSQTQVIKKTDEFGNEFFIPTDPANSDYQAYLKYQEENNAN